MYLRKNRPEFRWIFSLSLGLHICAFLLLNFALIEQNTISSTKVPTTRIAVQGLVSHSLLQSHIQPKNVQKSQVIFKNQTKAQPLLKSTTLPMKKNKVAAVKPASKPTKIPPRALAAKASTQSQLSQAKKLVSTTTRSVDVEATKLAGQVQTHHKIALASSQQKQNQGASMAFKTTNAQRLASSDVSGKQKLLPDASNAAGPASAGRDDVAHTVQQKTTEQSRIDTSQALIQEQEQKDLQKKHQEQLMKQEQLAKLAKEKAAQEKKIQEAKRIEDERIAKEQEALRLAQERAERARQIALDKAEDRRLVAQFSQSIVEKLRPHYHLPPGLSGQWTTILQVQLNDQGYVQNVQLKQASGNDTHDRSAIAAIMKASPLPLPTKKSARENFLVFDVTVSPKTMQQHEDTP